MRDERMGDCLSVDLVLLVLLVLGCAGGFEATFGPKSCAFGGDGCAERGAEVRGQGPMPVNEREARQGMP